MFVISCMFFVVFLYGFCSFLYGVCDVIARLLRLFVRFVGFSCGACVIVFNVV